MSKTTQKRKSTRAEIIRRRRAKKRRRAILIRILVACLTLFIVVGAVAIISKVGDKKEEPEQKPVFGAGISFEGETLGGLTFEEGKAKVEGILKKVNWSMKVDCGGDALYDIQNLFTKDVDSLLQNALDLSQPSSSEANKESSETDEGPVLALGLMDLYDASKAASFAKELAAKTNTKTRAAVLIGYDANTGEMQFANPVPGQILDQEDFIFRLEDALAAKNFQAVIKPIYDVEYTPETMPKEYTVAAVRGLYKKIGHFTTDTTPGNTNRETNLKVACGEINGIIVNIGEEFSFLGIIGQTTEAKGYKPATMIQDGEYIEELGGGICQVATTLYNAVVKAGLDTTERHNHSLTSSYVPLGDDAMVSWPYSDMKFENNSKGSILLLMRFGDNKVWADIYGIPILEEGVELKMEATETVELPIPKTEYIEDPTLEPGTQVTVTYAKQGYRVVTYLVTYKNGEEVSREFLHNSVYNSRGAVIRRNSSEPETETSTVNESAEANSSATED